MPGSNDIVSSASGTTLVRARRTIDQSSVPSGTLTTINFNIEDYDLEGAWNGATYTVPKDGFYEFLLFVRVNGAGTITGTPDLQLVLKVGTITYAFQRLISGAPVNNLFISGFFYIYLLKNVSVQLQILAIFSGATAIKIDATAPAALVIKRY